MNKATELSLNARLLVAVSAVLAAFLGLTGFTLDRAFRESALSAVREQLKIQIYALLGAADLDAADRLSLPETLPEPRFANLGSGLYAQVVEANGQRVWQSRSMLGIDIPFAVIEELGRPSFREVSASDGARLFTVGFSVHWETTPKISHRYTFYVAETMDGFYALVGGFRRSLWGWLAGVALVLLWAQALILRWGLTPLRRVASEVGEIGAGRRAEITEQYPVELRALTESLNGLIRQRSAHLERYRNALGDLAHSLKTPLAVLRGALAGETTGQELRETIREQVEDLHRSVDYQLQRAAASGRGALSPPVAIEPIVYKLQRSLAKVYAHKTLRFEVSMEPDAVFYGDAGDLTEILGNVLDNACKWARREIRLRVSRHSAEEGRSTVLCFEVEDDGPGIPLDKLEAISTRGVRADPRTSGHGIGLAVVREIVEMAYGGTLVFGQGALGGALVRIAIQL